LRRLATVYDTKSDYKSEIDVQRKLVKLDANDMNAAMSVPRLYDKMDQLDTAITESKKIVDSNLPDAGANNNARILYAELLVKKKDYTGALAQYAELIKSKDAPTKSSGYY